MTINLEGAASALGHARAALAAAQEAKGREASDLAALKHKIQAARDMRVAASKARANGETPPDTPSLEEIDEWETQSVWRDEHLVDLDATITESAHAVKKEERAFHAAQFRWAQENKATCLAAFLRDLNAVGESGAHLAAATALCWKYQDPSRPERTPMSLNDVYGPFAYFVGAMDRLGPQMEHPYSIRPNWLPKNRNIDEPIGGVKALVDSMQQEIEA